MKGFLFGICETILKRKKEGKCNQNNEVGTQEVECKTF